MEGAGKIVLPDKIEIVCKNNKQKLYNDFIDLLQKTGTRLDEGKCSWLIFFGSWMAIMKGLLYNLVQFLIYFLL